MAERAGHHRRRQIGRVAGARDHGHLGTQDAAAIVIANVVLVPKAMAAAGDHEIIVTIEPQLDGPTQLARRHRRHAGKQG